MKESLAVMVGPVDRPTQPSSTKSVAEAMVLFLQSERQTPNSVTAPNLLRLFMLQAEHLPLPEEVQLQDLRQCLTVFTSAHAVAAVSSQGSLVGCWCAAVGPGTAAALAAVGVEKIFVAPEPTGASLARELAHLYRAQLSEHTTVFFRGETVHGGFSAQWLEFGLPLKEVVCYRMRTRTLAPEELKALAAFAAGEGGCIAVSSRQVFAAFQLLLAALPAETQLQMRKKQVVLFAESLRPVVTEAGYTVAGIGSVASLDEFALQALTHLQR